MLKPLAAAKGLRKLNVISAMLVSEHSGGREWVCHTKNGKLFHLIYQHGVLQSSNVVEREYDLVDTVKPIATNKEDNLDLLNFTLPRKNRNKLGFKDIIDLMGWKTDDDQYFE